MEKYQFIKQIGQGSYGDVWLVKCSKTRKKHILKRIDLYQVPKREQRAAHLEIKLLSTIKHPNIVTYIDSFHNSNGSLYIVMNYCECDLHSFIKNQNGIYLAEKQIVHWFVQICLALKYLHDKNIVHRNLKTRNIFLCKNKVIKVGDLGISRIFSEIQDMNSTLIETPYYISPEIFAGEPYNQESDIWALGCCMYEITTLRHPFVAQDIQSIIQKIKKGKLPPIPEMYSSELFHIILSMLNQNAEKRPCVTKLLLNDYIRRNILIILEDNSKSPNQELLVESKTAMEHSTSISKEQPTSLPMPKEECEGKIPQKTKSTNFLPKHMTKSCDIATKIKPDTSSVISVPDINGNGDGNDNSQHRRVIKPNKTRLFTRTENKELEEENIHEIDVKYRTKSDSDLKESVRRRNNSVPSSNNLKDPETSLNTNKQKAKSEISFRFLSNLTYSLHNTRYKTENFMDKDSYGINLSQVKSPEYALPEKQSILCVKTRDNKQNIGCSLPHIRYENKTVKISKSAENVRDLPALKTENSEMSDSKRIRQHIMKNTEGKIDGTLLKNIVVNKKIAKAF